MCSSGPHINLNTRTPFQMFNKHQCLIWPQRNTTGLPDIKRRIPWNRASHLHSTNISAKSGYLSLSTWQPCARTLSTVDKHACFLKTMASLQFSDLHFNIFSEKCNSSSAHVWERERERERERRVSGTERQRERTETEIRGERERIEIERENG